MQKTSLLLVPAVLLLAACQPKENTAGLLPKADRAPHFDETARFLELGGVFYGFIDMTDQFADLGDTLTGLAGAIKETTPGAPPLPLNFSQFMSASGLSGLQAVGMSSRELEPNFYHNRAIFLFPEGVSGLFTIFGDTSGPFASTGFAPANSDLVVETGYRPTVLRDRILEMAGAVAGPLGSGALASQLSMGRPELGGRTANQLIESLGNRITLVLEVTEDGERIEIEPGLSVPEMQGVVVFDGVTELLSSLRPAIESQPMLTWTETETGFEITSGQTAPPPFEMLKPLVVADTEADRVFLASTREYLERCMGSGDKLKDSPAFEKAMTGLPSEGISLSYLSPELLDPLRELFTASMNSGPTPMPRPFTEAVAAYSFPKIPQAIASVTSIEPNGLYAASNAANSHRTTVVSLAVQPMAIMAAMAIPAFQKVRENSQRVTVTNNLRQIATAGQMYLLENGVESVTYGELTGDYFPELQPVAGESYSGLTVEANGTLSVTLRNGEVVEYSY